MKKYKNSASKMVFSLLFLSLLSSTIPTTAAENSEHLKLIFKGCANQKFQSPNEIYTQNLKTLLSSLVTESNSKSFYTTTQNSIMGLYQCRGDLTTAECSSCIARTTKIVGDLCGDNVIAARIQLNGCYLRYEVVGFKQVPLTEFLYKVCGKNMAGGVDFDGRRDTAFGMIENGVKNNSGNAGNGLFYTGSFEEFYVLGQCEGDLNVADCEDCVKSAIDDVKSQCGESTSGQVYLHKCFVSYSYYPRGVGNIPTSSSGPGQQHTQRTVAIAVGGVAALGFLIVCLMFLKSAMKRRKSNKSGDW